jgi:hypothetical protein
MIASFGRFASVNDVLWGGSSFFFELFSPPATFGEPQTPAGRDGGLRYARFTVSLFLPTAFEEPQVSRRAGRGLRYCYL